MNSKQLKADFLKIVAKNGTDLEIDEVKVSKNDPRWTKCENHFFQNNIMGEDSFYQEYARNIGYDKATPRAYHFASREFMYFLRIGEKYVYAIIKY